jgi:hypothetical protein
MAAGRRIRDPKGRPVSTDLLEKNQYPVATAVELDSFRSSWGGTPATKQTNSGSPARKPGDGARLAVRKFGKTLNKLAES